MTGSAAPSNVNAKEQALRALAQLPPFSPILNRLIASLAQEDVSFAKISDLIEKDTALAGNVLRLVNSALYGLRGTVNSIRHAVSLLGIAKLRNATLSMSVARMWSQVKTPPGWSMARFNLHSVGVAILADLLTQQREVEYAEGAFAAGLFHDLGLLLVALGLPEEYKQITLLHKQSPKWIIEYEQQVLGLTHLELSAEALAVWNLPEPIQTAVRFAETPDLDPTVAPPDGISLSRVLNIADRYVKGVGTSLSLFEGTPEDGQLALESLGLGDRLPEVLTEFQTEFSAIQSYF
ncbi:MAG TPA: HDOD domain-containing protein [Bryobacteraceae bacterium]|nr:HDOD domain-containing protein [Bryobacteraceae bacterium]